MQELDIFAQSLGQVLEELPEIRRSALEEAGQEMLQAVRGRIGGTGRVQRWQAVHMGSGGGYAAVRARAREYDEHGTAVGYVTNALESGHKVREPSGRAARYRPRKRMDRVPGKHMYAESRGDLETAAARTARKIEAEMEKIVRG